MKCFDFDSLSNFDKHISMSIPNYEHLFEQIVTLVETFSEPCYPVLDIGCSTGRLIKAIDIDPSCKFGIDLSGLIDDAVLTSGEGNNGTFIKANFFDVNDNTFKNCSVIVSMFFLQFLGSQERKAALLKIKEMLMDGGRLIVCEKTSFEDSQLENVFRISHLEWKRSHFTDTEILDKSVSIMRSMRVLSEKKLFEELSDVGTPELFFKSMGFSGYIIKHESKNEKR